MRLLYQDTGRAGVFFRMTTLDILAYAARRMGDITDNPADIDNALRWGFGWTLGPFQVWDILGFERVREDMINAGMPVPDWVASMPPNSKFYRDGKVYIPSSASYQGTDIPADEIGPSIIKQESGAELWANEEAALLDMGEEVALFEFRSKANTLGKSVITGLMEAIDFVENHGSLRGMVIGNEGKHFSVGANLKELGSGVKQLKFSSIDQYIDNFQQAMQRVRYAAKPVVVAVHQRALGGGCELVMACPHPVAAAESYMGLVEVGVGLIPAGSGCMRFAAAASATNGGHDSDVLAALMPRFEQVAKADVATSAHQAIAMGFMPHHTKVVMRGMRRFHVARNEVISLSGQGYMPPVPTPVRVLGQPGYATLKIGIHQLYRGGFASSYDCTLAEKVAWVMTGGDLSAPQEVTEQYLLDLERQVFLRLLRNPKTLQRIIGMLRTGKPVRN